MVTNIQNGFFAVLICLLNINAFGDSTLSNNNTSLTTEEIESLQASICVTPFKGKIEHVQNLTLTGERLKAKGVSARCLSDLENSEASLRQDFYCFKPSNSWNCTEMAAIERIEINGITYEIAFDRILFGFEEVASIIRNVLVPAHTQHNAIENNKAVRCSLGTSSIVGEEYTEETSVVCRGRTYTIEPTCKNLRCRYSIALRKK